MRTEIEEYEKERNYMKIIQEAEQRNLGKSEKGIYDRTRIEEREQSKNEHEEERKE